MLVHEMEKGIFSWKRIFKCFSGNSQMTKKEFNRFKLEVYGDLNYLQKQSEILAQDQYAKAHLDEYLKLSDRMQSALMRFDEIIKEQNEKIKSLEEKIK